MGIRPTRTTELAFRSGYQTLSPGTNRILTSSLPNGAIDVSPFYTIRVSGFNSSSSATNVTFFLTHNLEGELFSLMDTITLAPGEQFSKSYDVPGTGLTIQVRTEAGTGTDLVDVAVFGF